MKRLLVVLSFVLFLSGCPGYHAESSSIEECVETGICQYSNKDIKTEGSELSTALMNLLIEEEDDMRFSYYNTQDGIEIQIDYTTYEIMTEETMSILNDIYQEIIDTVDSFYHIDLYRILVKNKYTNQLYTRHKFTDQEVREEWSARFFYVSTTDITEEQMLEYIENHSDQLVLLLQSDVYDSIYYYSASYTESIRFHKYQEGEGYLMNTNGVAESEAIIAKMNQILTDNGITLASLPDEE